MLRLIAIALMLNSADTPYHIQPSQKCILEYRHMVCFPSVEEHSLLTFLDDVPAQDILEKGLSDLIALCDVVIDKFEEARDKFEDEAQ
jgi:hypothetical protein